MRQYTRIAGYLIAALAFAASAATAQPAVVAPSEVCPSLNANGKRLPLENKVAESSLRLGSLTTAPPAAIAGPARAVVMRFEGGGADPYTNISGRDGVSLGMAQWNHGSNSLYSVLLKEVDAATVDKAPERIRADLKVLDAAGSNTNQGAIDVIKSWRTAGPNDPVVREIRSSVRADLAAWLGTPDLRAAQAKLAAKDMAYAYALAQAWRRDMAAARNEQPRPVDARLLTYFYDLKTYNGGIGDLWVGHVVSYRKARPTAAHILSDAASWLTLCKDVVKDTPQRTLYSIDITTRNIDLWQALPPAETYRLDEDALDLLTFGLMRAQRSTGDDPPRGFPGVYQVDVFYRRAIEAIGFGYPKGSNSKSSPVDLYADAVTQ